MRAWALTSEYDRVVNIYAKGCVGTFSLPQFVIFLLFVYRIHTHPYALTTQSSCMTSWTVWRVMTYLSLVWIGTLTLAVNISKGLLGLIRVWRWLIRRRFTLIGSFWGGSREVWQQLLTKVTRVISTAALLCVFLSEKNLEMRARTIPLPFNSGRQPNYPIPQPKLTLCQLL